MRQHVVEHGEGARPAGFGSPNRCLRVSRSCTLRICRSFTRVLSFPQTSTLHGSVRYETALKPWIAACPSDSFRTRVVAVAAAHIDLIAQPCRVGQKRSDHDPPVVAIRAAENRQSNSEGGVRTAVTVKPDAAVLHRRLQVGLEQKARHRPGGVLTRRMGIVKNDGLRRQLRQIGEQRGSAEASVNVLSYDHSSKTNRYTGRSRPAASVLSQPAYDRGSESTDPPQAGRLARSATEKRRSARPGTRSGTADRTMKPASMPAWRTSRRPPPPGCSQRVCISMPVWPMCQPSGLGVVEGDVGQNAGPKSQHEQDDDRAGSATAGPQRRRNPSISVAKAARETIIPSSRTISPRCHMCR